MSKRYKFFSGLFLIALLSTGAATVNASECRWVDTEGAATIENLTPEEAQRLALSRARLAAIEKVAPIKIAGSTLVSDSAVVADFIQSLSSGYVLEEKVGAWTTETIPSKQADQPPVLAYVVKVKSCVAKSDAGDPFFRVKAGLNRTVFQSGEEAVITAACTKDCYLTIVNLMADGKIRVLLPNKIDKAVFIKSGEEYKFPRTGLSLVMETLPGHKKDTEAFVVIATREKFDALTLSKGAADIKQKDFYKAVLAIPPSSLAEEILLYEVRERN